MIMYSDNTLEAARSLGRSLVDDGIGCMYMFTDPTLQRELEVGYAARYEEEQQLTNQCEEQENVQSK